MKLLSKVLEAAPAEGIGAIIGLVLISNTTANTPLGYIAGALAGAFIGFLLYMIARHS
jgi:flagellar motor component MotA